MIDEICRVWNVPSFEDILGTERILCTAVQCFADEQAAFGVGTAPQGDALAAVVLLAMMVCGSIVAALAGVAGDAGEKRRARSP